MRIGIIGTRGIPNHYGGFEQFAEYVSVGLVERGHSVAVYNSHTHPYQEKYFKGVQIIHCKDLEDKIGTIGQFFYDLNCILDSRKRNFDIILQLGYTSSSIWSFLMPKSAVVVTNMDGLEWKRTKYSKVVQRFLRYAESLAVRNSHHLVSDSIGIKNYIQEKYGKTSTYIPYGATPFKNENADVLQDYSLKPYGYDLLIARLEPENSIEVILDGVVNSVVKRPFLVVGNHETKFGNYLKAKFGEFKSIHFLGGIYKQEVLNNLRRFSNLYFHGHTVGGTNPSLLEAMASHSLVCAHKNVFNHTILGVEAFYFSNSEEVTQLMEINKVEHFVFLERNIGKIDKIYSWEKIIEEYLSCFQNSLVQHRR